MTIKAQAWKTFADWIKKRDNYFCVTCGSQNDLQAGHFWHAVLDFDEMNINTQCKKCNHYLSGNLAPYSAYLLSKYGEQAFKDLEKRHYIALGGEKRYEQDYRDLIAKYSLE